MVFQKSNRFPKSIYENIAYTFRIAGIRDGRMIDETVEDSLRRAALPVGDLRLRYGIKMGLAGLLALFCTQVLRLPHDNWAPRLCTGTEDYGSGGASSHRIKNRVRGPLLAR
jgi:hypothetical protein